MISTLKQQNYYIPIQTVRWCLGGGVLLFALISLLIAPTLPKGFILLCSITLLLANFFMSKRPSSNRLIAIGLAIDGLFIFIFTALSGGAHNPFAMLLLIPVIFAAQCLPLRWTWYFSAYSIFLYTMLFVVDHYAHHGHNHHQHAHLDSHLLGMLVGFILICLLLTYFVAKTSSHIQRMELQAQQDERLVMLGAFAAQAAHQLGTPLSSITLLINKIRTNPDDQSFHLIKNELERCKSLIQELADKTEQHKATSGGVFRLDKYIRECTSTWTGRTHLPIELSLQGDFSQSLVLDKTLQYAMYNLFDNSLEAGAANIFVTLEEHSSYYQLSISDDGPGINEAVLQGRHRGLGLYLTEATIKKLGGELKLTNLQAGGAHVKIVIPKEHYV